MEESRKKIKQTVPQEYYHFIFVNGILNNEEYFNDSVTRIREVTRQIVPNSIGITVEGTYNSTHGQMSDIWEATKQMACLALQAATIRNAYDECIPILEEIYLKYQSRKY